MRWLWAAYRKGALPELPPELSQDDFHNAVLEKLLGERPSRGAWLLWAPAWNEGLGMKGEGRPIGFMIAYSAGAALEPHVLWFPWSSPRNRLEAVMQWLNEARKRSGVIVFVQDEDKRLYERLEDFKVLRRAGTLFGYWGNGKPALLFETIPLV